MVSREAIQATCDDIVREFTPLQVILFGSYAYGTPTENSDVDLLVVMDVPKSEFRNKALEIQQRIPSRFSLDVLVRSPEEIASRLSYNDWFLRDITEKGDCLYGSDVYHTKRNPNVISNAFKREQDGMNPLTLEWIEKAEEDYNSAKWLQQAPDPGHNSICFHAQQCIEKYLKAWLQEANVPVPRTHDLEELLSLIVPTLPAWSQWQPDFKRITEYAVDSRYPGESATANDTQHAMRTCDAVRHAVRTSLKLSTTPKVFPGAQG